MVGGTYGAGEDLPESDPQRQKEEAAKREPITKAHVEAQENIRRRGRRAANQ